MSASFSKPGFNVAHLTTAHGSTDNRIYRKECAALHDAGVSVVLVSRGPAPEGEVPWVAIPENNGRLARMVKGPWQAWREIRHLNPNVLHIHDPELIPIALLWKTVARARVIYDAHEDLPKQIASKPYLPRWSRGVVAAIGRLLELTAARHFDAVVAATPAIARNFRRANRLELVQNFPWLWEYPAPEPVAAHRSKVVCYVGGLTRERGSAEMTVGLLDLHEDVHLTFAGTLTPESREDLSLLRGRWTDLGTLLASEVPAVVTEAALGLVLFLDLPNHREAQPTKLFEYMAAARPFVASGFPHWLELVGEYNCGIFVDPSDSVSIRDAVNFLVMNPLQATEMGRRGRQALERNFTFEHEVPKLVRLTIDLLP